MSLAGPPLEELAALSPREKEVLALIAAQPGLGVLVLLCLLQWGGLLAERWIFFADARHPQTLYHAARA